MFQLNQVKYKNILNIEHLHIPPGCISCILGESGSGKTTLLKLLNKMYSPSEGKILYQGFPLSKIEAVHLRREVAMLPQTPVIFPGTIRDNLNMGLKLSEKPLADPEKLAETLEMIHLKKDLSDPAENLSGGEKQRLGLGRVILMNPNVFLLDEPSSALDEDTANIVIEKLKTYIIQNGKTLIMVTHSKTIAEDYSQNRILLRNGCIMES